MTVLEARDFFKKYYGSKFMMVREELPKYRDYKDSNISKRMEDEWTNELYEEQRQILKETGDRWAFSNMCDLSVLRHPRERIFELRQALDDVEYKDSLTIAFIAESVLGRLDVSQRKGMVFWADQVFDRDLARDILQYIYRLLQKKPIDQGYEWRIKDSIKRCQEIDQILKLDCLGEN